LRGRVGRGQERLGLRWRHQAEALAGKGNNNPPLMRGRVSVVDVVGMVVQVMGPGSAGRRHDGWD